MMVRMYKPEARKRFNAGEQIFVLPCKANINSPWFQMSMFAKDEREPERTFDRLVRAYEWANCNSELGYYTAFYREEK